MPVRKLSLGQRMRCDLVASLLHHPKILFLDEPTIGLDVVGKLRIREFLGRINKEFGTTIILTTHDLDEIEKLCRRVMIIDKGKLIYDGTLEGLRQKYSPGRRIVFQLSSECDLDKIQSGQDKVKWKFTGDLRLQAIFKRDATGPAEVISHAIQHTEVHDLTIEEPSIEEIVRKIYEEGIVK